MRYFTTNTLQISTESKTREEKQNLTEIIKHLNCHIPSILDEILTLSLSRRNILTPFGQYNNVGLGKIHSH